MWLSLPGFLCCLLNASFVTRDLFFIDFSLKLVLVIYLLLCFATSALVFFLDVLLGLCLMLAAKIKNFNDFYCILILLY